MRVKTPSKVNVYITINENNMIVILVKTKTSISLDRSGFLEHTGHDHNYKKWNTARNI